ncbi:MAG: response regulator [Blastocatellia bacterium]|nr:response regulator [Blastocatellia bacterium]
MHSEIQISFLEKAGERVARTRAGLLLMCTDGGSAVEIAGHAADLIDLAMEAEGFGLNEAMSCLSRAADCLRALASEGDIDQLKLFGALDEISIAEAVLLEMPLASGELIEDVSSFVDDSFDALDARLPVDEIHDFEIDEETLEIFRSEADELLTAITHSLAKLTDDPSDVSALWEIRRSAHTFKGAAGIVGMKSASRLAHRLEDLLDKMVESRSIANADITNLIARSNSCLISMLGGGESSFTVPEDSEFKKLITKLGVGTDSMASNSESSETKTNAAFPEVGRRKPVVRVALDRLDDLIGVSRRLIDNRNELSQRIAAVRYGASDDDFRILESLFASQCSLTDEMQEKLLGIRMVRFGTLETRLKRTVNLTCQDEGKKTDFEILTPDIEIDTQLIDALIEPLLHLLKNAVVHGIESPDARRLIGKSERGYISVSVQTDEHDVILTVDDDGKGISAASLKEKAVASGLLSPEEAAEMPTFEAWELIFNNGLTTAEKVDLNAGRGIGMNIVREAVEAEGGRIGLSTQPQVGTIFTIRLPLVKRDAKADEVTVGTAPVVNNAPRKVLVVDDSALVRHHNSKIAEAAGCVAVTANDGAEALTLLLNGQEFDLILSDVEMPQMDGWELLQYVKTDEHFGHIPIAMVTSLNSPEHLHRALGLGAESLIAKPLSKESFANLLNKLNSAVNEPAACLA